MADAPWAPPESDFQQAASASDTAWAPPESDFAAAPPDETPGRVAGLGARALGKGAAQSAGSVVNLANPVASGLELGSTLAHAIKQKLGWEKPPAAASAPTGPAQEPQLSDFIDPSKWGDAVDYLSDKAGLPKPATPGERVASAAVGALPSAVLAPEAPITGALSAAAGSGASQIAAEKGASPLVQGAVGLAAGSAGGIGGAAAGAATRGLTRGASGANMTGRLADAAASGNTNLTVGQASGNKVVQALEALSSKLWGGGRFGKNAEGQADTMGEHVNGIVDQLSGGTTPSPTTAGAAVEGGIATAKGNMRAAENAAYTTRDKLVDPTASTTLTKTLAALDKHGAPIEGAEPITAIVPSKIAELRKQVFAAAAQNAPEDQLGNFNPQIPYKAATELKSRVGNMIDWGYSPSDPQTNGALKDVWGALKDDTNATAAAQGPAAVAATKNAEALYAANQEKRDNLNRIINQNGGPENVYRAATNGTKLGATTVTRVMNALQPDQQNLVRATVLARLGRGPASSPGGSAFNPGTFLTNWDDKNFAPEAKNALFGASGSSSQLRSNLDQLTRTMGTIRSSGALHNPSGTGAVIGHIAGGSALVEGLMHAFAGHPAALMGAAGAVGGNLALARAFTSPAVTGWLARSTKLPRSMLPNAINQLGKMNDPDAQNAASALNAQSQPDQPIARASGGKVDIDSLVNRLMTRWKSAKKESNKITEPLLKMPDDTIHKALHIAQAHI